MKNVLGMLRGILKGENKFETLENYSIFFICAGAFVLFLGIGLTVITTRGVPAILAMLGAFISFVSTVALILVWLAKDIFGD